MKTSKAFIFRLAAPLLLTFGPCAVQGAILANPSVQAAATPFSGAFVGSNVFDNGLNEYASANLGTSTFLEFNFGAPKAIDGFVNVTRNNTADNVGNSRLIFDTDGTPGFNAATDTVVNFTAANTGNNGQGFVNRFSSTTAQFARWEVLTSLGPSQNLGAMEMSFLSTTGSPALSGVTILAAANNPFGGNYVPANAINGIAGRGTGPGVEYASNTGVNLFMDFDMGGLTALDGFDFFDRIAVVDHIGSFDMIFSNDPTFATTVATKSYTKGAGGAPGTGPWTLSDSFAPVNARYVRFDSTSAAAAGGNLGIGEILFYGTPIPEPSGALLALSTLGGLLIRRRR